MVCVAQWLGYQIVTLGIVSSNLTAHPNFFCVHRSMVDHLTVNQGVGGSSPPGRAFLQDVVQSG